MKKIFALVLSLIACMSLFAVDYDAMIDNLYYKFSGSTATVVGCKDLKYWSTAYELPYDEAAGTYWTVDLIIPEKVTFNAKEYTVTQIGQEAFQHKDLHSAVIPSTVTYVGEAAFAWTYLTFINIPEGITTLEKHSFAGLKVTDMTLPSTLNYIGEGAMQECHQLQNINIPDNVITIGARAFSNCEKLASVKLPANLRYIDERAFENSGIQQISIPNSVISIGSYAFYYTQLKSISITNPNCSIGEYVFWDTPMENATLAATGKYMFITYGNNQQSKTQNLSINLLDGLTWIAPYAFCNTDIETISIPTTVNSIGEGAFDGCTELKSVSIPDNTINSFESSLFRGCKSLKEIIVPEGVTIINEQVFSDCSNLQKIVFPSTLNSIEKSNFSNYYGNSTETNLEVHIPSLSQWMNMNFARDEEGDLYFSNPVSCSSKLFIRGEKLPEILQIPNDVYNFYFDALGMAIKDIKGIEIPLSVENVYRYTSYSSRLKWMRLEHTTPPGLDNYNFWGIILLVPCGCIRAYRDVDNWREFSEIWDIPYYYEFSVNQDFIIDNYYDLGYIEILQKPTCENDLTLIVSANPRIGYHFVKWSDGSIDNPRTIPLSGHTYLSAEFAEGEAAVEKISSDGKSHCTTLIDGQLLILREGKTYTIQGQEVR